MRLIACLLFSNKKTDQNERIGFQRKSYYSGFQLHFLWQHHCINYMGYTIG